MCPQLYCEVVGTIKNRVLTFMLFLGISYVQCLREVESKTADVLRNVNSPENMAVCWSLHFVSSHHYQRNTFYVAFGLEHRVNLLRMNIAA